jgi:hypothetical protein
MAPSAEKAMQYDIFLPQPIASQTVSLFTEIVKHTFGVQLGLVPSFLADVYVDPSLAMHRVDFRPDVVLGVPHPADS